MNRNLLTGAAILTLALAAGAPKTADALRGGGFGGGGFHAGGGGAWHAGGVDGGWHAGAIGPAGGWHAGGVTLAERPSMQAASPARAGMEPPSTAALGTVTAGTPAAIMPAAFTAPPSSTAIMAAAAGAAAPRPSAPRRLRLWRSEPSSPPSRRDAPINTSAGQLLRLRRNMVPALLWRQWPLLSSSSALVIDGELVSPSG